MHPANIARIVAGPLVLAALLGLGWWTRDAWKSWLLPAKNPPEETKEARAEAPERVQLSEQARKNLRLVVKEIRPTTYWRKIYLPGAVVDRPGHSDRGIPAPIAGRITRIFATPGKTVHVGDELFRLLIASESFQTSQMELFKNQRELEIVQKEHKRLDPLVQSGAMSPSKLLALDYQQDRFKALVQAYRQDLLTRQLSEEQIKNIEKGQFVTEVVIRMPNRLDRSPATLSRSAADKMPVEYEVQELKVNLGDHVQAGQILAYVSDHRYLYIEGKALKQEARLLTRTAKEGWPVEAEFSEDDEDAPGEKLTNLTIEFMGNTMDPTGLTLPFYLPFVNPQKEYVRQGKPYHLGQYRPGQKVLLKIPIAKFTDVFVVPIAAVVREGPDAYVFRQNGSVFERTPVHVLSEDVEDVVIADDGSIRAGAHIVQNAADALQRALKAGQASSGGGHEHHHHHH